MRHRYLLCAKRTLFLLPLCLALLACGWMPGVERLTPALPAPTLATAEISGATVTYYDIRGSTVAELSAAMNESGPVAYDGWKGAAATHWYISWEWPGYGSADCRLDEADISYQLDVTLPRWKPPADVSPELVAEWNDYIRALAGHEQRHVDFVPEGAAQAGQAIRAATCETAEEAAQAAVETIRQRDRDYDAATNHGATQGAIFP